MEENVMEEKMQEYIENKTFIEMIMSIIAYIPNKIAEHFEYIRWCEAEINRLDEKVQERDDLVNEIEKVITSNGYKNPEVKKRKIVELIKDFQALNNPTI